MATYNRFYIGHAAVTDFYRFSVEDFVKFAIGREICIYQLQKFLTDIRLYRFAEWRVEPDYVSGSLSSPWSGWVVG